MERIFCSTWQGNYSEALLELKEDWTQDQKRLELEKSGQVTNFRLFNSEGYGMTEATSFHMPLFEKGLNLQRHYSNSEARGKNKYILTYF